MTQRPSSPSPSVTLLLAAVRVELHATVRRLGLSWVRKAHDDMARAQGEWAGRSVLAAVTGIGAARAVSCMQRLLEEHGVARVIHVGFAGGLAPSHQVGEVLRFVAVRNEQGERLPLDTGADADADADTDLGPLLLSVDRLVAAAADKRALHERTGAAAVDMETYAVAAALAQRQVPLTAIRAISDPADTSLPAAALQWVSPHGEPSVLRTAGWLMRDPGQCASLYRLAHNARRAAHALALEVERVL